MVVIEVFQPIPPQVPVMPPVKFTVMGHMDDPVYQQCVEAAEFVNAEHADEFCVSVRKMLGCEYETEQKSLVDRKLLPNTTARVVAVNSTENTAITGEDFVQLVLQSTEFKLFKLPDEDERSYRSLARANNSVFLRSTGCMYCWMVVKIGDMVEGRIVLQLYSNVAPRTCQNFLHLCRGDLPDAKTEEFGAVKLHYKGSSFYRTVPGGWVQGGDVTAKGGNGGWSAFGRSFPDESFAVKHNTAGIIGMVNDGEHTSSSSFYITQQPSSWMDGRYVAFGRVVEGMHVVNAIAAVPTKHNQSPTKPITISDCGEIPL